MSDHIDSPNAAATLTLQERVDSLNAAIAERLRLNEVSVAIRDELIDLIATLSKKPRVRRPRAVEGESLPARPANDTADGPRPSVFAAPANDEGAAEAA